MGKNLYGSKTEMLIERKWCAYGTFFRYQVMDKIPLKIYIAVKNMEDVHFIRLVLDLTKTKLWWGKENPETSSNDHESLHRSLSRFPDNNHNRITLV